MKRYYAAAIITLSLLLTGCFSQDYSDCSFTTRNFVLKFELQDGNGASIFADKINSIDAVVYDADNRFVTSERVTRNDLNEFPGIILTVKPGEYRVVCWGNVGSNSSLKGTDTGLAFGDCYLETVSNASGCPLYYAPDKEITDRTTPIVTRSGDIDYGIYSVTVPPNAVTTKEIFFKRAHRTVNVYLKGYEAVHGTETPHIRVNNIPMRYDFFLRTGPSRKNYQTTCTGVSTLDGNMMMASFNAPITSFSDNMTIEIIRGSDSRIVTTVNLKDYVEANASKIKDLNEFGVQISYDVHTGSVDISLPGWENRPIEPEW